MRLIFKTFIFIQPLFALIAYIAEYPIAPNDNGEYQLKVFSLKTSTMHCGNATYFIKKHMDLVLLLKKQNLIQLGMYYQFESSNIEDISRDLIKTTCNVLNFR